MRLFTITLCCAIVMQSVALSQEDVLRPRGNPGRVAQTGTRGAFGKSEPFYLGVEFGPSFNMYSADVVSPRQDVVNLAKSASGLGGFINFWVDVPVTSTLGIRGRIGYDTRNYSSSGVLDGLCTTVDEFGNIISSSPATFDTKISQSVDHTNLALLVRANISNDLFVTAGPVIELLSSAKGTTASTILTPDSCFYNFRTPEQSKSQSISEANDSTFYSARIGIDVSIGYRMSLNSTIDMAPFATAQLFITELSKAESDISSGSSSSNHNLNSIKLGLSFWFKSW